MNNYIIIVIVFSILIFSCLCAIWIISWSFSKIDGGFKIRFEQFISMYRIAPEKWNLYHDGSVSYQKSKYSIQMFHFSPIDYLRFLIFLKERDKRKEEQQWLEMAKMWQNDIGKFQESYIKELQNKIKEI